MKETNSFFNHAHIWIIALTLVITFIGSANMSQQISHDESYAWFGYVPASIQPVISVDGHQIATQYNVSPVTTNHTSTM